MNAKALLFPTRTATRPTRARAVAVVIGVTALGLAYSAHLYGRPVTAALISVFGVVAIAALLGLRAGVVAGLIASIAYNLLFTDPYFRFSVDSIDDLVPIIALNFSAIASGLIAGRLHDRAVAAETSGRRVAELLKFSEDLQGAVALAQMEEIVRDSFALRSARLFVESGGELRSTSASAEDENAARELWHSLLPELHDDGRDAYLLTSPERRIGVLLVSSDEGAVTGPDIRVFLPLLTLAIQRCLLAEELTQADVIRRSEQFKTTLLSSVSHDLRTPLAAIAASASSLARFRTELDEPTKVDLLATIQEQCDRLDRLTANLLNLGRIEGGLNVNQMPVVDAVEVLGIALSRARKLNASRGFERDFRVASAAVRADEPLLEQVFFNVLENAAIHTPSEASVKVSAELADGTLLVSIEDDGPGIPSELREQIFERFYQGNDRRQTRSGSGLGLPIAKGFAELIGGTITAGEAALPLHGARIDIALPLTGETV